MRIFCHFQLNDKKFFNDVIFCLMVSFSDITCYFLLSPLPAQGRHFLFSGVIFCHLFLFMVPFSACQFLHNDITSCLMVSFSAITSIHAILFNVTSCFMMSFVNISIFYQHDAICCLMMSLPAQMLFSVSFSDIISFS